MSQSAVLLIDCPDRTGLAARGRDLERVVLSRAVRWHLERRILCSRNKTVVFD
jgi:formyltetrahydrofolate hydrolase